MCAEGKRPSGKVVKACIKIRKNLMGSVVLTGDFFVVPVEEFEAALQELTNLGRLWKRL